MWLPTRNLTLTGSGDKYDLVVEDHWYVAKLTRQLSVSLRNSSTTSSRGCLDCEGVHQMYTHLLVLYHNLEEDLDLVWYGGHPDCPSLLGVCKRV